MRETVLSRGRLDLFGDDAKTEASSLRQSLQQRVTSVPKKFASDSPLSRHQSGSEFYVGGAAEGQNVTSHNDSMLPRLNHTPLQIHMAKPSQEQALGGGGGNTLGSESVHAAIQQSATVFTSQAFKKLGTARSAKKRPEKPSTRSGLHPTAKSREKDGMTKLPGIEKNREAFDEEIMYAASGPHVRFGDNLSDESPKMSSNDDSGIIQESNHATDRIFRDLNVSSSPTPAPISSLNHATHPSYMNANAYVRLLNSSYDYQAILKQAQRANPDSAKAMVSFLAARCKKMQGILQCMYEVATEGDSEKAMSTLLRCALEAVEGKHACLYTIDETTSKILVRSSNWMEEGSVTTTDKIFWGMKVLKGDTVNVYNAKTCEQYTDEVHEQYGKLELECIMMAPIFTENFRVSGAIEVINKAPQGAPPYFNAEDEFVLKALSSVCTLLLNHSQVRQQALRKSDDIRVLLNTASLMSSELDLGDLIRVIMQTAQELLNAERCALFMIDKEKGELWSSLAQSSGEIRIAMNKGIAGHVATTGEVLNIPNAYLDSRFNRSIDMKTGFKTRNILCMPMRNTQGEIIGVTQVINKLPDNLTFTKEDELLLMAFSALAAVTIEKSILFKALQVTLHETSQTRNFLSMILQSITNVLTINHPAKLDMEEMIATMRLTSFDYWLGKENSILIADIQRAYRGEGTISAQDYELVLNDKSRSVNYNIVQMTEQDGDDAAISVISGETEESRDSRDSKDSNRSERKRVTGVVIVMEDISKEKRVMNTLGRYMNPALVHKVMSEGGNALGGTRQKISVVFADLRNFTTLSETLDPSHVVSLLNMHYTSIVDSIMAESGVLDKYIGDAAMAVFGVPFIKPDDSTRAVASSIRMRIGLEALNKRNKIMNLPILKMGIGISTGMVLSGNIGSPKRMEYTVIGEAVNIASRIENATKAYGTMILICDKTREEVKDHFHLREVDAVIVKGKTVPVTIYEVLGPIDQELPHELMTSLVCYELGLAEYRNQNWSVAMSHFKKAIQITDDNPSKTFLERCKGILEGVFEVPPLGSWDGCWKFETK
ncbi:hypothetical protein HDU67_009873 [Dinochytrium kinnereticum]|nr:hypothetical protein HDU67_009873 [Dinochytrium kinnereticum]